MQKESSDTLKSKTGDTIGDSGQSWLLLKERLKRSKFRSRFTLLAKDRSYMEQKGIETIRKHAVDFITQRLAPDFPLNDGRQTPMRGHPVFIAQHATGTCCRDCLFKWHGIKTGRPLEDREIDYIVNIIMNWILDK